MLSRPHNQEVNLGPGEWLWLDLQVLCSCSVSSFQKWINFLWSVWLTAGFYYRFLMMLIDHIFCWSCLEAVCYYCDDRDDVTMTSPPPVVSAVHESDWSFPSRLRCWRPWGGLIGRMLTWGGAGAWCSLRWRAPGVGSDVSNRRWRGWSSWAPWRHR